MRRCLALSFAVSVQAAHAAVLAASLDGQRTVYLSANPAQPYTKPMVLTLEADGFVKGSF